MSSRANNAWKKTSVKSHVPKDLSTPNGKPAEPFTALLRLGSASFPSPADMLQNDNEDK